MDRQANWLRIVEASCGAPLRTATELLSAIALFGGRLVAVMHEIRLDEPALRRIESRSGDFR